MAVDTRNERASILGVALPFGRVLPHRDGSVDAEDFEHLAYLYRGVPASPPTVIILTPDVIRRLCRGASSTRSLSVALSVSRTLEI
ncbi:MAG TPA: hypothetical protein VNP04_21555 [Alphaproteobacteria bacterium]|nr:hypothetical protein [Alphaproteobacteria bacterium]